MVNCACVCTAKRAAQGLKSRPVVETRKNGFVRILRVELWSIAAERLEEKIRLSERPEQKFCDKGDGRRSGVFCGCILHATLFEINHRRVSGTAAGGLGDVLNEEEEEEESAAVQWLAQSQLL